MNFLRIVFYIFIFLVSGAHTIADELTGNVADATAIKNTKTEHLLLKGDLNKVKLLLQMEQRIPTFFTAATTYDVPPLFILDNAEEFILKNPEILKDWNESNLLNIHATVEQQTETINKFIRPEAIEQFKKTLTPYLNLLNDNNNFLSWLQEPFVTRTDGAITYLIQLLPTDLRKKIPKDSSVQKLYFLREHIELKQLQNFDFNRFGITSPISPHELFAVLISAAEREQDLVALLALKLLGNDAQQKLQNFQASDFDLLIEKNQIQEVIFKNLSLPIERQKHFKIWISRALPQFAENFFHKPQRK